jgi:hypothetical protein
MHRTTQKTSQVNNIKTTTQNSKFVKFNSVKHHEYIIHYRKHGRHKKKVVQVKIKSDVLKQMYFIE